MAKRGGKHAIEAELAALNDLRFGVADESAKEQLRTALRHKSNHVAAKAASVACELALSSLIPDLVEACARFFEDPVETDPKCAAKIAILTALRDLGHQDPDLYVGGLTHVQMEPSFGRPEDSAVPLRAVSAQALVTSFLDGGEILRHLTDRLADAAPPVRAEAARAIANLGHPAGVYVLRLKVLIGDDEPAVVGECLCGLLSLGTPFEFAARFLDEPGMAAEAAAALIDTREPEALKPVIEKFRRSWDPLEREALLTLIGTSPLPESAEFLYGLATGKEAHTARLAHAALKRSRHWPDYEDKLR